MSIGLCAYILRIRKARSRDKKFAEIRRSTDPDAWQITKDFITRLRSTPWCKVSATDDSIMRRTMQRHNDSLEINEADGTISGIIEFGEFGRASRIVDASSADERYACTTKDANIEPFYFRFVIPDGSESRMLLVCQQNGRTGLSSSLRTALKDEFSRHQWTLDDCPVVDDHLLADYLRNGRTEEIRVRGHKLSNDRRALMHNSRIDGEELQDGTVVEVVIRRKEGLFSKTARGISKLAREEIAKLIEVSGLKDPEEVVVRTVKSKDGKPRSFRLIKPGHEPVVLDITKDVAYNSDQHPEFQSIHRLAKNWSSELWDQLQESTPE